MTESEARRPTSSLAWITGRNRRDYSLHQPRIVNEAVSCHDDVAGPESLVSSDRAGCRVEALQLTAGLAIGSRKPSVRSAMISPVHDASLPLVRTRRGTTVGYERGVASALVCECECVGVCECVSWKLETGDKNCPSKQSRHHQPASGFLVSCDSPQGEAATIKTTSPLRSGTLHQPRPLRYGPPPAPPRQGMHGLLREPTGKSQFVQE